MLNNPSVTITPPRVPLVDVRSGAISREWYMFFLSLYNQTSNPPPTPTPDDPTVNPDPQTDTASLEMLVYSVEQTLETLPATQMAELQAIINDVRQQLETLPRRELGTMAELQQANLPWVTFDTSPQNVPPDVGTVAWDGGTTLGVQATPNVLMRVGESEFVYAKASSAITKGQLCYHTGSVGSSGVITVAPTPLALSDPNALVGVAAEDIALNSFGLIQISGDLRGFNTTGSSVGEVWADGDPLYYNPAYVGALTKTKPTAPNQKSYIGEVINAGSGGSGSINIRIVPGTILGGTDSNVQITSVANGDLLQYVSANSRWENKPLSSVGVVTSFSAGTTGLTPNTATTGAVTLAGTLDVDNGGTGQTSYTDGQLLIGNSTGNTLTKATLTASTGISITNGSGSITITNSAPDQTVTLTGAGGAVITGTYPNFTITTPSGTVTSVAASGGTTGLTFSGSPITSSGTLTLSGTLVVSNGGTGATTLTGYVKGNGTSAFTASATIPGSDISGNISGNAANVTGTVAVGNGGTGITSYAVGDLLYASGTGTLSKLPVGTAGQVLRVNSGATAPEWYTVSGVGTVTSVDVSGGTTGLTFSGGPVTTSGTITMAGTLGVGNGGTGTTTAFTAGSVVFAGASGVYSQNNANLFWDNTNAFLGIGTAAPGSVLDLGSGTLGRGIGWGGTTVNYSNIWSSYSAASIVLGANVMGSTTSDTYLSSYGGASVARAALRVNGTDGSVEILNATTTTTARGSSVSLTKRFSVDTNGYGYFSARLGVGTTSPTYPADIVGFARGAMVHRAGTYTAGSTTPSVDGITFLYILNSGATTITNFTNGVDGQVIYLLFGDGNTTVNRSNCYLAGGANFVSTANDTLVLLKYGAYWYEISRSANS